MKLKKMLLIGATLATTTFTSLANVQADTTFEDVPTSHWAYDAIMHLKDKNIIAGYGNGMFGLGDNITRGQAARLLYVYLQPLLVGEPFEDQFTDVKGTMFEKEIYAVTWSGLMNGYGYNDYGNGYWDNKFGPDDVLTREQLAVILQKTFNLKQQSITTFNDVEKNYWATEAISALQENKIAMGTGDNLFEPKKVVTREQYAQFLYSAMSKLEKPGQPEVMPLGIPRSMVTDDFTFDKSQADYVPALSKSMSKEAQGLINDINVKYNLDIKYEDISFGLDLTSSKMSEGNEKWYQPLSLAPKGGNNFSIFFVNHKASIELTKRWITMIHPDLNLDKDIDEFIKNVNEECVFYKGQHKMKMGKTANNKSFYLYIGE
ncbi:MULTISPECIES: S-layer homology domain-containing protein [unclassified Bacillus (in: firmicutes)]|uniref:S-layer homology domain-containing protein n=1 Tax=unclassified Bacillus (in: firmicutes) TaxID=185979 RepID=UPI000BF8A150|nr:MULTISPECIES: S-layer homology domain-containing protein [unclassified Bacillus (in: firmicutes)]PEU18745.1 S-layer protein [Bacillus sp. AFS014408]PFW61309.1 S-layer protein [Bacillus sp. AFS075034]